jgi:transcriptional regulator with XRE-family HTH domain
MTIRGLRLRAGLSQEELARRAGLSVRAIRDLESKARRPRLSTVRQLATALNLDDAGRLALASSLGMSSADVDLASGVSIRSAGTFQAMAVPRQLPADVTDFTGRQAPLTALSDLVDLVGGEGVVIAAISGTGGVGKTALAVHWGHRMAERFPDGQLFVDLRGFSTDEPPASCRRWGFLVSGCPRMSR